MVALKECCADVELIQVLQEELTRVKGPPLRALASDRISLLKLLLSEIYFWTFMNNYQSIYYL